MGTKAVTSLDDRRRREQVAALAREHRPFLEAMAARLCRSQLDPDDLVQDVLERLLNNIEKIPADQPIRTWLVRVMHNRFIDLVRRVHPTAPVEPDDVREPEPEPEAWWHRLSSDDIRARIDRLPPELRDAFRLHALEGKSYQDIAAQLGISRNTVGTRILRARRRMRDLFTGNPDE